MKKYVFILIFSLTFVGCFFSNISHASAATLYFNAAVNHNWSTLGNWWTNSGFTLPAGSLPTISDDVIISSYFNTSNELVSINTIVLNGSAYLALPVTVSNGATFNDSSYSIRTVLGNATFYDSSFNSYDGGVVTGNAIFNDSSYNSGTVNGNATFTYASDGSITLTTPQGWGTIHGVVKGVDGSPITNFTFNGASYNIGNVAGDSIFNDSSLNDGIIVGNAAFYGSSRNHSLGIITGNATFNDLSYNDGGTINGDAIFNYAHAGVINIADGGVWGNGTVNGSILGDDALSFNTWIFNGSSYSNDNSTISGNAIFNDTSNNANGTVISGDATFNDTSYNLGNVAGDSIFNDSSVNYGTITSDATFNDSSYNGFDGSEGVVLGNAIFYDSSMNTNYGTVAGDACFTPLAINNGTVSGSSSACINLTYVAGNNGTLTGDTSQILFPGTNGTTITAIPDNKYKFKNWSDGSTVNPRTDVGVVNDVNVIANFIKNTTKKGGGSSITFVNNFLASNKVTYEPISNPIPNFHFTNKVKPNTNNTDVKELQKYLNTHGFPVSTSGPGSLGNETSFFGPKTKAAVMLFQKSKNLKPDGIVGPKTLAMLN